MITDLIKKGLKNYAENYIPTGSFLRAVLENDLRESFARAEMINSENMHQIVMYCYNHIPSACWGSPEKVKNWLKKREE